MEQAQDTTNTADAQSRAEGANLTDVLASYGHAEGCDLLRPQVITDSGGDKVFVPRNCDCGTLRRFLATNAEGEPLALLDALSDRPVASGEAVIDKCVRLTPNI